jgi:hypothetical protein
MPEQDSFDYAIVRIVPRVERGEFVNAGVIVFCRTRKYLDARVELDERRALALDPTLDLEEIVSHLSTIPKICSGDPEAGPIALLSQSERFNWLVAPRSTIVQCSAVHSGLCSDPTSQLERLLDTMVRLPKAD